MNFLPKSSLFIGSHLYREGVAICLCQAKQPFSEIGFLYQGEDDIPSFCSISHANISQIQNWPPDSVTV